MSDRCATQDLVLTFDSEMCCDTLLACRGYPDCGLVLDCSCNDHGKKPCVSGS
jgi:hypothetical protein